MSTVLHFSNCAPHRLMHCWARFCRSPTEASTAGAAVVPASLAPSSSAPVSLPEPAVFPESAVLSETPPSPTPSPFASEEADGLGDPLSLADSAGRASSEAASCSEGNGGEDGDRSTGHGFPLVNFRLPQDVVVLQDFRGPCSGGPRNAPQGPARGAIGGTRCPSPATGFVLGTPRPNTQSADLPVSWRARGTKSHWWEPSAIRLDS